MLFQFCSHIRITITLAWITSLRYNRECTGSNRRESKPKGFIPQTTYFLFVHLPYLPDPSSCPLLSLTVAKFVWHLKIYFKHGISSRGSIADLTLDMSAVSLFSKPHTESGASSKHETADENFRQPNVSSLHSPSSDIPHAIHVSHGAWTPAFSLGVLTSLFKQLYHRL